jgi:tocopherol O-methyltransferase
MLSRSDSELKQGIAKFYDESSAIWLDVWGEDMHHGYYPPGVKVDHKEAQLDMIDRSLLWAYDEEKNPQPKSMVDVGCGVGGSSRHISRKYPSITKARGISLSPYQIQRATDFTRDQGLNKVVEYSVDDATNMSFGDNQFDLTWSMESGEHMPNKEVFFNELFRVTAPGGRIIIVTWCHREFHDDETELTPRETRLLNKINDAYFLPDWVPASDYLKIAQKLGLEDIRTDDWSEFIAPFWPAVFWSALVPKNFFRLLRTGKTTIKGAVATLWMLRGFQKGLVKFALITGRKPQLPTTM